MVNSVGLCKLLVELLAERGGARRRAARLGGEKGRVLGHGSPEPSETSSWKRNAIDELVSTLSDPSNTIERSVHVDPESTAAKACFLPIQNICWRKQPLQSLCLRRLSRTRQLSSCRSFPVCSQSSVRDPRACLGALQSPSLRDAGHSPASNRMPPRSSPTQSSRPPYCGVMGLPVRGRLHTSFTEYNLV